MCACVYVLSISLLVHSSFPDEYILVYYWNNNSRIAEKLKATRATSVYTFHTFTIFKSSSSAHKNAQISVKTYLVIKAMWLNHWIQRVALEDFSGFQWYNVRSFSWLYFRAQFPSNWAQKRDWRDATGSRSWLSAALISYRTDTQFLSNFCSETTQSEDKLEHLTP